MGGRIPEEIIQQVKDRVSIREVVSDYVTLKRSGANYKGLCPFHKEKTPSFMVHDGKQIFRCFGCGEGGTVFNFLMKMEGLSYPEAVRKLAGRAGIEIPEAERTPEEKQAEESRSRLFRANELAEAWFQRQLLHQAQGRAGLEYLLGRGLTQAVIERFRLGYSLDSWDGLLNYLRGQGVPETVAHEAGLVIPREGGGFYDRFRGRIMFPIRDVAARVRGFGGRVIGAGEPKYLNSPETAVFKKGQGFYGLDQAKEAMRKEDRAVVVEGYLDLIALAQHGIGYAVATLGTALTPDHASLLRRYTQNIFLVFDGDEAGTKASLRALEIFLEEGLSPRIALMPADQDPDNFVRAAGAEGFAQRLETAPSLVDFFMDRELAQAGPSPAQRSQAIRAIAPVLARIRDPIERDLYRRRASEKAGVSEVEVERRMFQPAGSKGALTGELAVADSYSANEQNLLYLLLHHPQTAEIITASGGMENLDAPEVKEFCRETVRQIQVRGQADPAVLLHRFPGTPLPDLISRLILEDRQETAEQVDRSVRDTLKGLQRKKIQEEKIRLTQAIREAESLDPAKSRALQLQKRELEKREREMRETANNKADGD